ncbi:MAG: hypothetical protein HGA95_04640, partial [Caldiserica bacterium]|nr:hypothetical protein [Caldisericota bacterium]
LLGEGDADQLWFDWQTAGVQWDAGTPAGPLHITILPGEITAQTNQASANQTTSGNGAHLYEIPILHVDGVQKLYIISFVYPRFLDLLLEEKAKTIVHELYHISESFDGDIRRFKGRTYAHSGRKANFDAKAYEIARQWLSQTHFDTTILKMGVVDLKKQFGKIVGTVVRRPRIRKLP